MFAGQTPKVSVLLTCYNNLPYLKQTFDALKEQSFQNFEILALDDGSTDGTRDWLTEIAPTFPNLRLFFHEKNLGTYGNLNFGIEQARGEWVAIYNDDDLWLPEKLRVQIAAIEKLPDVALVHTSGWFIDENNDEIPGAPLGFPWPFCGNGMIMPELIYHNKIITSSAMLRTDVARELGGFDASFYGCGDWQMWLRVSKTKRVWRCDDKVTLYRVHSTQACRDDLRMQADDVRIRTWLAQNTQDWLKLDPENNELRKALAHNFACLGSGYQWLGKKKEARNAYLEALKMNPIRLKTWLRLALTILPADLFRKLR